MKDYLEVVILFILGGVIIASIAAIGRGDALGQTFVYAVVGIAVLTASMLATFLLFRNYGRARGFEDSTGLNIAALLTGIFVTAPICVGLAFMLLKSLLGHH